MSLIRVVVTGATGLLGQEIKRVFHNNGYEVDAPYHKNLDITDFHQVAKYLRSSFGDVVINCAAYTAVDKSEAESTQANIVNGLGVRNLALVCEELDIPLVHISTDYVFGGEGHSPWRIFDERDPVNAYGYSKYLGERYLESINPKYYLVRTSWLFGAGGPNFVSTMLRLAASGSELHVVSDQFGCPTYAADLAIAIADLVETGVYGTYHITNQGITNWYDYAELIVKEAGYDVSVIPVSSAEFPRPARRPNYSALDPFPLEETIGHLLRPWQDAVLAYLEEIKAKGVF